MQTLSQGTEYTLCFFPWQSRILSARPVTDWTTLKCAHRSSCKNCVLRLCNSLSAHVSAVSLYCFATPGNFCRWNSGIKVKSEKPCTKLFGRICIHRGCKVGWVSHADFWDEVYIFKSRVQRNSERLNLTQELVQTRGGSRPKEELALEKKSQWHGTLCYCLWTKTRSKSCGMFCVYSQRNMSLYETSATSLPTQNYVTSHYTKLYLHLASLHTSQIASIVYITCIAWRTTNA